MKTMVIPVLIAIHGMNCLINCPIAITPNLARPKTVKNPIIVYLISLYDGINYKRNYTILRNFFSDKLQTILKPIFNIVFTILVYKKETFKYYPQQ